MQWKSLLNKIENIEQRYGNTLNKPASDEEILILVQSLKEKYKNVKLSDQYISFLQTVNGLEFNGLVIYGIDQGLLEEEVKEDIQGFIEINELWHENDWQRKYLFFGDSDTAWYCYDLDEDMYFELDKPSGSVMESFEDFDSMLKSALETSLL